MRSQNFNIGSFWYSKNRLSSTHENLSYLFFFLVLSCFLNLKNSFSQSIPLEDLKSGKHYYDLASEFQGNGEFDSAIAYSQIASRVYHLKEQNLSGWLRSNLKISAILQRQKLFDRNVQHLDTTLASIWGDINTPSENRRRIFLNMHQGFNYYKLRNYIKSIEFYQDALAYIPADCGTKRLDCLDNVTKSRFILYPLNLSYLKIGDHQAIIDRISDKFLKDWQDNIAKDSHYDYISKLYSLKGQAYLRVEGSSKDTLQAYKYLSEAYFLPSLSEEQEARVGIEFGRILHNIGRSDEGIDTLKSTIINLGASELGEKTKKEISSDANLFLGYIHRDRKDYPLAIKYADIAQHLLLSNSTDSLDKKLTAIYSLKGEVFLYQQEFENSRKYYRKALTSIIPSYKVDSPISNLHNKALVPDFQLLYILRDMGTNWKSSSEVNKNKSKEHLENAIKYYRLALHVEDLLKNIYFNQNSRLDMSRKRMQYLPAAIEATYQLWEDTKDETYLNDALFFFEKSQAQELQVSLARNQAATMNADSSLRELYKEVQQILRNKTELKYTLDSLKLVSEINEADIKPIEKSLEEVELMYTQYSEELNARIQSKNNQNISWLNASETINFQQLQQALGHQTGMVSFFESEKEEKLFILYIGDQNSEIREIKLDSILCKKIALIKAFLKTPNPSKEALQIYQDLGYQIYQQLLSPVENVPIEKLIAIPSPLLHDLPLGVLLTSRVDTSRVLPYRELDFLWQKFPIRYLEAATLINIPPTKRPKLRLDYVGFAPDYSIFPLEDRASTERNQPRPLIYNQEEITTTAKEVLDSTRCEMYLKDRAIDSTFLRLAPESHILHLSMHANLHPKYFLYSYLQFLPSENMNQPSSDNGKLYMHQIYTLPIYADLVILSACETGLGEFVPGEGIMSLGRAFQFAGSRNILMSLWRVDDYSSSKFVPIFMKYLQEGYDKDEALQKARMDFVFDQSRPNTEISPYYWSQFVLYGDDLPVGGKTSSPWMHQAIILFISLLVLGIVGRMLFKR